MASKSVMGVPKSIPVNDNQVGDPSMTATSAYESDE
jgi:hypothetical protein